LKLKKKKQFNWFELSFKFIESLDH